MQRTELALGIGNEPGPSAIANKTFGDSGCIQNLRSANTDMVDFVAAAEQSREVSTVGDIRASKGSMKTYDINVHTAVDLSKGWPAPEVRASGPPRNPMLRHFTPDVRASFQKVLTSDRGSCSQVGSQLISDIDTIVDQARKASLDDDDDEDRDRTSFKRPEAAQMLGCNEPGLQGVCIRAMR